MTKIPDTQVALTDLEKRAAMAGMSKVQLCERAGISLTTFNRWKRGYNSPTLSKLALLEATITDAQKTIEDAQATG